MAYSQDYRQMILAKLEGGASFRELAEEFHLSTNTIQRWKKNPERKKRIVKPYKFDNELLKADVEILMIINGRAGSAFRLQLKRDLCCIKKAGDNT
ncbi:IS630 transposase-related protein [Gallibacterium anatis]|uniref:IS630 transposase-related protein n=1 Tax=Gallibacterium anatis TaxID=750 RepID=UPI001E287ED9|nr:IS630 transposase-related protein [Gallibacterium anatis]